MYCRTMGCGVMKKIRIRSSDGIASCSTAVEHQGSHSALCGAP